jgi:O-antigen ligase
VQTGDFKFGGEESLAGRARMFARGIQVFLENPILGVGLDMFRTVDVFSGKAIGQNAHSNYIEVLATTGIIGGVLYYAMYYCWWSRLIKAKGLLRDSRHAGYMVTAVMMAAMVLVFDVGFVSYYEKLSWLFLAGLIADANLLLRHRRNVRF